MINFNVDTASTDIVITTNPFQSRLITQLQRMAADCNHNVSFANVWSYHNVSFANVWSYHSVTIKALMSAVCYLAQIRKVG